MAVIKGEPGTTWTNGLDKAQWQFHCNWANTCGLCAQFDGQIARSWPIPMHHGCRCYSTVIFPGQESRPFTDYRETIRNLSIPQQKRVIGAGNYRLLESGVVKWDDIVTQARVRTLTEVMAREKVTIKAAVKAGVKRSVAQRSYEQGHSAGTDASRRQARAIAESLKAHGLDTRDILRLTGEKLAERVGIGGRPAGGVIVMSRPVVAMNRRIVSLLAAKQGIDAGLARAATRKLPEAEAMDRAVAALGEEIASQIDVSGLTEAEFAILVRRVRNATSPEALAEVLRFYRAKPE